MATAEALCLLVAVVICRGQEQGVAGDIPWTSAACRGRYSGELDSRGQPHGFGSFACSSHNYTGQWEGGLRHGRGVAVFSNGDTYTGRGDIPSIVQLKRGLFPNVTLKVQ